MARRCFGRPWSAEEDAVLDRIATALARGRYASAIAAVAACRRELARTVGRVRSAGSVWQRLLRRAPALGWDSGALRWTRPELGVCRRTHDEDDLVGKYCRKNTISAPKVGAEALKAGSGVA